jgi:hypothetical protein
MTPSESWAYVERQTAKFEDSFLPCLLELRARVEALETNSKPSSNSSQIGSLLVERVAAAIFEQFENNAGNEAEARAAIREVAAWLDENTGGDAAWMLTQEADRG